MHVLFIYAYCLFIYAYLYIKICLFLFLPIESNSHALCLKLLEEKFEMEINDAMNFSHCHHLMEWEWSQPCTGWLEIHTNMVGIRSQAGCMPLQKIASAFYVFVLASKLQGQTTS